MNYIKNLTRFPVKIQFNQFHALELKELLLNFSLEKKGNRKSSLFLIKYISLALGTDIF